MNMMCSQYCVRAHLLSGKYVSPIANMGPMDEGNNYIEGEKSPKHETDFQSEQFVSVSRITRSQTARAYNRDKGSNDEHVTEMSVVKELDFQNKCLPDDRRVTNSRTRDHLLGKSKTTGKGKGSDDVRSVCGKRFKHGTDFQAHCLQTGCRTSEAQTLRSTRNFKGNSHDFKAKGCVECNPRFENAQFSTVSKIAGANGESSVFNLKAEKSLNNNTNFKIPCFSASTRVTRSQSLNATATGDSKNARDSEAKRSPYLGNSYLSVTVKVRQSQFSQASNDESRNSLDGKNMKYKYVTCSQSPYAPESNKVSLSQIIKSAADKDSNHDPKIISYKRIAEVQNPHVSIVSRARCSRTRKNIVNDESLHKRKSKRRKRGQYFKTGKPKMKSKSKISESSKTIINAEDSNGLSDKNERSKHSTNPRSPRALESKGMSHLQSKKSSVNKGNDQDSETSISNMHFAEIQDPHVSMLSRASHSCTEKNIANNESQHKRKPKRKQGGKYFKLGKTKMHSKSKISQSSETMINAEDNGLSDKNEKSKHATNPQNPCTSESKRMSRLQTIKSAVNKSDDHDSEISISNMHFEEIQNPHVSVLSGASHSCAEKNVNNESQCKRKLKRKKRGKHFKTSKAKMCHESKESDNMKQNLSSGPSCDIENNSESYFQEQSYMQKQSVPVLHEYQNIQVENCEVTPLKGPFSPKSSSHNFVDHLNLVLRGQKSSVAYKMGTKQLLIDNIANFHPNTQTMPFRRLVTCMAWHPTYTSILAVASECGDILLWDIKKCFQDMESFRTNLGESVSCIKFHNNKPLCVYTALLTGELLLQNLESKSSTDLLDGIAWNKSFTSLDVSFKKKILIAGDNSGCACLTSLEGEQITKRIRLHKSKVTHIEFSTRDDYLVATTSTDNTVRLWDLRRLTSDSRRCSYLTQLVHSKSVNSAYFSTANGSSLLTTGLDEDVKVYVGPLWHLETVITRPNRYLHHRIPIKANWHPLHNIIVMGRYPEDGFGSIDGLGIGFYDGQNGELLHQFLPPIVTGIVSYNSFNPTGEFLASGAGSKVVLWKSSDDTKTCI